MSSAGGFVAIVGAGPAGLMAAEVISAAGVPVEVFDAMPSVGRKFLLAGKGGLNLTHSEAPEPFASRYGDRRAHVEPWLRAFGPTELRAWAGALGVPTFVGTSGRVFPQDLKAAPLLRAWLQRLRAAGVAFHQRHRWLGWDGPHGLRFAAPEGERRIEPSAVVLALGGASWPQLGSDGRWLPVLQEGGIDVAPLRPSNCGFDVRPPVWRLVAGASSVGLTPRLSERHAGAPVKPVAIAFTGRDGAHFQRQGEFVVTATGVEGSLIYAASAALRYEIAACGEATLRLDLLPGRSADHVAAELARPRGSRSLSAHLKRVLGLDGVKAALLHEVLEPAAMNDPVRLAAAIKSLPLRLAAPRPVEEAISTAGGVRFEALDDRLMCRARPGVFCAGEMLDWEAPTGGYLLTACFASGRAAGQGVLAWLGGGPNRSTIAE